MTQDNFWWYITVEARKDREEFLVSLADLSGCIGAEMSEAEDNVRSRLYFVCSSPLERWNKVIMELMLPYPDVRIIDMGRVENREWHTKWKDAFPPKPVGSKLIVMAPWHDAGVSDGRLPVRIDPGSAFGTGYHESTQIVLELMEKYIKPDMVTADIGTGSGILTIGALKMGAKKAYARDIDPAVIEEVEKNLALNGLADANTDLAVGDLLKDFGHKADLLTANILIEPNCQLVQDVPKIIGKHGIALFSGMLEKEKPQFLGALAEAGMEPVEELVKGEWWGVAAKVKA